MWTGAATRDKWSALPRPRLLRREPGEHVAVAGVGSAPAPERLALELAELADQLGLFAQPALIASDHLRPAAVAPDLKRVAPLRGPADVDVIARALAVHDVGVCHRGSPSRVGEHGGLHPPRGATTPNPRPRGEAALAQRRIARARWDHRAPVALKV